jgi:hypothetical protein
MEKSFADVWVLGAEPPEDVRKQRLEVAGTEDRNDCG